MVVLGFAFTLGVAATGCKKAANNNTPKPADEGKVKYTLADSASVKAGESAEATLKREGPEDKLTAVEPEVKVEGNDKVTATIAKFEAKKKEVKITIKADAEAKGTATLKVTAGDFKGELKVTVEKAAGGTTEGPKYTIEESATVKAGAKVKVTVKRDTKAKKDHDLTIDAPEDSKLTAEEAKIEKGKTEGVITISAPKDAKVGKHKVKIKAGDKEVGEIEVTVTKAGAMNILPGRDLLADARRVEALPQFRVSIPRQVALFTRVF